MNRWGLLSITLLLILLGGLIYRQQNVALPVRIAQVRRADISEYVDERGKTRLRHTYDITMPFTARLEEIELEEGDPVSCGQIVAQVDRIDLKNELDEAQAVVERLQASIAENEEHSVERLLSQQAAAFVTSMAHTVESAEARTAAGLAWQEYAERFRDRTRELHARNAKSSDALELAEVQLIERGVEYQQDKLVWQSLKSVLAATELLPQIVDEYISHKSLNSDVLRKQEAEAQARLRQVTLRGERGSVCSPIDGVVLAKHVDDAQFTSAGTVLLQIGRMSDLEVEVDVLSQDATRIQPGATVEIYALTTGDDSNATISGVVSRVYPQAFTKISSLGVEQQRVRVIILFADTAMDDLEQIQVGADYRIRVRIFTRQEHDALIIPQSALFRSSDGLWQVFAVRDGRVRLRDVTVGLMNDEQVQVNAGLDDEEEVILAPENDIQDGIRVKAAR